MTAAASAASRTDLVLVRGDRERDRFDNPDDFVAAILKQVPTLPTIDALYAFWEANIEGFRALRLLANEADADPAIAIISVLKARARMLGEGTPQVIEANDSPAQLAIPKEKRIRSKEHMVFVGKQPCLVCGRRPAQAHHLRFAQPRAMALKVSDEYTVPLCSGHHDSLHRTGDERAWWARNGILDPLKMAGRLWAASRLSPPDDRDDGVILEQQASGVSANERPSEKPRAPIADD